MRSNNCVDDIDHLLWGLTIILTSRCRSSIFHLLSSGENMMGDFTYDIKREYWGSIEMVGSSIAVAGKTHANLDNSGNAYIDEQSLFENEVGFFSMIDSATSEGIEGVKSSS